VCHVSHILTRLIGQVKFVSSLDKLDDNVSVYLHLVCACLRTFIAFYFAAIFSAVELESSFLSSGSQKEESQARQQEKSSGGSNEKSKRRARVSRRFGLFVCTRQMQYFGVRKYVRTRLTFACFVE